MNADYVENIIRNIDKQSYKCILVDGAWGIGKSYMVRKALEDMKDRTCFISLFGMDDVQKYTMKLLSVGFFIHLVEEKLQWCERGSKRILGNFDGDNKIERCACTSIFLNENCLRLRRAILKRTELSSLTIWNVERLDWI